jgi:hypothetical protein
MAAGMQLEPFASYRRTVQAFRDVREAELRRARNELDSEDEAGNTNDATLAPFWQTLLGVEPGVTPKQRLQAFAALEDAGAFLECTCRREPLYLTEDKDDAFCAYVIRLVLGRHYRAALFRVSFPDTFLALRDEVDAKLLAEARESKED